MSTCSPTTEVTDHQSPVVALPRESRREAYAKLGDESCEQVFDLRERRLLIMLFKGCRVARGRVARRNPRATRHSWARRALLPNRGLRSCVKPCSTLPGHSRKVGGPVVFHDICQPGPPSAQRSSNNIHTYSDLLLGYPSIKRPCLISAGPVGIEASDEHSKFRFL